MATTSNPSQRGPRYAIGSQRQLMAAAVVSFIVHALLLLALAERPLGWVDPELLAQRDNVFRVYRAEHDLIIDDTPIDVPAAGESPRSIEDLSKALLEVEPAAGEQDDAPPPDVNLRHVPDSRPDAFEGELAVNLPDSMLTMLGQPVTLGFVAEGGGDGPGGGGVGEGSGSSAARRALSQAGLVTGSRAARPLTPSLDDQPIADDWSRDLPAAPAIDFMGLALGGTTRLNLPEHLDDDFEYTVYTYTPEPERGLFGVKEPADKRGYFRVDIRAKRSLVKLPTMPKDVVFLVDTSESVDQFWVNAVLGGVQDGLSTLNEGDRFNIVMFKESPQFLSADAILPATKANIDKAVAFLTGAQSGGYTDVNAALQRLLVRDTSTERVYNLIFISDGQPTRGVRDTRELINLITRDNLDASIYCVGVGARQNRELLDYLAYLNRGFRVFVEQTGETRTVLRSLCSRLRYPIMKDVHLEFAGLNGDVYPTTLPNIHQGERFSIYGRYTDAAPFTMRIHGRNGQKTLDLTFRRNLADALPGEKQMMTDWAFWKLHHIYSLRIQQGESQSINREIEKLRKEYGLKTIY